VARFLPISALTRQHLPIMFPQRQDGTMRRLLLLALLLRGSELRAQTDSGVPPAVLTALRETLASRYVTPLDRDSLARYPTADALLASLGDRHTILFSPEGLKEFQVMAGGRFGGIGARLGTLRDTVYLTSVMAGSPAAKAGLSAFDRIVSVDGQSVVGLPVDEAVTHIRGPVGTIVHLAIRRGSKLSDWSVSRDSVAVPSIGGGAILDGGIAVLRLRQFGPGATAELVSGVDQLLKAGAKGLVLDLRGNPGGLLEEAVSIAQLFLPAGAGLVEVRGRPGAPVQRARAMAPPRYPHIPLAVLLDASSASAAEVLAGALQDGHRATVLGTQSYGKGSVQEIAPLPEGWAIKLTIARWYTPAGRGIDRGRQPADERIDPAAPHQGGIAPDVTLAADSTLVPPAAALTVIPNATWRALADRIADWTEHAAASGASAATETDGGAVLSGVALPDTLRPRMASWVTGRLTESVMSARYGEAAQEAWRLTRDREVEAARAWMAGRAETSAKH
jgi:C-terminal peptidase prc